MGTLVALYELANQHRELSKLGDSDELPEDVIRDTLEALEGTIEVKAVSVAKFSLNLDSTADAIEAAAKAMTIRAKRVRNRADAIRAYLQFNMSALGIREVSCPEFTIRLRENPESVKISEGVDMPKEFMVQPEPPPPRPDKKALKDAIKAGRHIDGVYLERGERLEIKV